MKKRTRLNFVFLSKTSFDKEFMKIHVSEKLWGLKEKYLRNLKKTKKIVSPKFPYSAQLLRSKFDFGLNNMILEVLLIVPIQKFNKA